MERWLIVRLIFEEGDLRVFDGYAMVLFFGVLVLEAIFIEQFCLFPLLLSSSSGVILYMFKLDSLKRKLRSDHTFLILFA